jgi:uncharacterized membrane protein YeiH
MAWEVFSIIGTIAFALSGAIVAMEEEFDLFGVYILGIVAAFGGGAIRNVLIGLPVTTLWGQEMMFHIALACITIFFVVPHHLIKHWNRWGNFTDAIGLSAFAIQGAMHAISLELPLSAVIASAVLTGCGGGMLRDLLAGRKPIVLRDEIYAMWAVLAALIIAMDLTESQWFLYGLFIFITFLRILSYLFKWKLPKKSLKKI